MSSLVETGQAAMRAVPPWCSWTSGRRSEASSILSSAWQAPNGRVGIVVTNISDSPQRFRVSLHAQRLELQAGALYRVTEVRNGEPPPAAEVAIPGEVWVELQPRDISLLLLEGPTARGLRTLPY